MISARNSAIAARFGATAARYDSHAHAQFAVANMLARTLPPLVRPRVLEIGCGTGAFSARLADAYPDGTFLFTDLSRQMIDMCTDKIGARSRAKWAVMDGEFPDLAGPFDLVASSMTLHWFGDPLSGAARLKALLAPGGVLLHATPAPDAFPEWRASLVEAGATSGLIDFPQLAGTIGEEEFAMQGGALAFLRSLDATGATVPRQGYRPLPAGRLRRAMRILDHDYDGTVTWRIRLGAETA